MSVSNHKAIKERRVLRRAFTLIELTVVIAIAALFMQFLIGSFQAWQRTSAVQKAVAEVSALLRRANEQARSEGRPYRIEYDAAARTFQGKCCVLDASRLRSSYEADRTAALDAQVDVLSPSGSTAWVIDTGAGVLDSTGEVAATQELRIELATRSGGQTFGRVVTLRSSGELIVSMPEAGAS